MLISPAFAQSSSGSADFSFLFLMIGIFIIFYFFLIRPNQKKEKERRNMQSSLKKGDKILTHSGIFATVSKASDNNEEISIEIPKMSVRLNLSLISSITGLSCKKDLPKSP